MHDYPRARALAAICASLVTLATGPVWAESRDSVLIAYEAPASSDCPTREEFVRSLELRGVNLVASGPRRPPRSKSDATRLEVRLSVAQGSYLAEVRVGSGPGLPPPRVLRGSSCAEVARAAELSAALALQSSSPAPALPVSPSIRPRETPLGGEWSVGLSVGMQSAPQSKPGHRLGAAVRYERVPENGWIVFSSAQAELGGTTGVESAGAASARINTLLLALDACGASYRMGLFRVGLPCGGLEAGVLSTSAEQVENERRRRRPWVAGLAGAELGFSPARHFWLNLDGHALLPLTRYSFELENPPVILGKVPHLGFRTRLTVRLSF